MRVAEGVGDLARDRGGLPHRDRFFFSSSCRSDAPSTHRMTMYRTSFWYPRLVRSADVGVLEPGHGARFATNRTASEGRGVSPSPATFTATSRWLRYSRSTDTAATTFAQQRADGKFLSRACCNRWRNVEISRDMADAKT